MRCVPEIGRAAADAGQLLYLRRKISRDVGADADRGLQHRARRDHAGDSLAQIRELPATTIVRLPNGREMTAANYNKMADTFIAIRKAGLDRAPPPKSAFSRTKGPAQVNCAPAWTCARW